MRRAIGWYLSVVWRDRRGVTAIEYAVLASCIIVAVAVPVFQLGTSIRGILALPTVFGQTAAAAQQTTPTSSGSPPPPNDYYDNH